MRGASLIILAMIMASAYSQVINSPNCGKRPRAKVVGGNQSNPLDWGWQVEMRSGGTSGGSLFCGGSLINERWVVCAAHCTVNQRPGSFRVILGHHDRSELPTQTIRSVIGVYNHPSYSGSTYRNDISLIKLNADAGINDDNIIPVCLPAQGRDFAGEFPNGNAVVTGWGTITGGGLALKLQEANVPITTYADCKAHYANYNIDETSMICAGKVGDGIDTCQGDSGGPVNFQDPADGKWYNIGITSWGVGCGNIGVYSRTSTYINWILGVIANNTRSAL